MVLCHKCNAIIVLFFLAFLNISVYGAFDPVEQAKAEQFLAEYNTTYLQWDYNTSLATWGYSSNLTKYNKQKQIAAKLAFASYEKLARDEALKINLSKVNEDTKRQLKFITVLVQLEDEAERNESEILASDLEGIYSKAKLGNDSLSPGLVRIMGTSRDYDELRRVWWGWRNVSGRNMRKMYRQYVNLTNKAARQSGFEDRGEWWRSWYEVDNLPSIVENLWNDLTPLYLELHAYVRDRLRNTYKGKVSENDYIEAHLLGNMWAQSWVNIYDLVEPYANKTSLDITKNLQKDKRYNTPRKLTELAESFFDSLGLKPLPSNFYKKSIIEKPKDREMVCHASAWDFSLYKDVRIKQCVQINHNSLVTLHHELGHIQYFLQYWDLPPAYRTGANAGFHEAVGDLMTLSVDTPTHLEQLGLLKNYVSDEEADINALMKTALRDVAFIPFGFLIDQWRWKVFSGEIKHTEYNKKWWELRKKYQGIKPPVPRSENDFDPGAKYHIPGDTPYIRYFVSNVLQFQFHKAVCKAANFEGPIYKCSIYKSTEAGKNIAAMLSMGKSKPWPFALEKMTGSQEMSVSAMKEYFEPLYDWMVKERCRKGYAVGWPGQTVDKAKKCEPATSDPPTRPNGSICLVIFLSFFPSLLL